MVTPAARPIPTPDHAPAPLRRADRAVRVTWLDHGGLRASTRADDTLVRTWDHLVRDVDAPVTMLHTWCRLWHSLMSRGAEARLALLHDPDDDALVGVLPFAVRRVRCGLLTLRVARLLGTDGPGALAAPPVDPSWRRAGLEHAVHDLLEREACDAIALGPLPPRWADAARDVAQHAADSVALLHDVPAGTHAQLELPGDDEPSWLESRGRNLRTTIRKGRARLDALGTTHTEFIHAPGDISRALDGFVREHTAQWRRVGRPGHFRDWPGAMRFHGALVHELALEGRARFHHLCVDDTIVARQYVVLHGRRASCRLATRAVDPRYDRCSLGQLSLAALFDDLRRLGVRTIDLGTGTYDYKRRLGATETALRRITLVRNRRSTRQRARLFAAAQQAIDAAYYRGWYHRIAPALARRTGMPRVGLHPSWIRNRL